MNTMRIVTFDIFALHKCTYLLTYFLHSRLLFEAMCPRILQLMHYLREIVVLLVTCCLIANFIRKPQAW